MPYQHKPLTLDVDRKLAIFYHPLFQSLVTQIVSTSQGYATQHPSQSSISFFMFFEFNLRLQKVLIQNFELSTAFVSSLNDWVKEVNDCYDFSKITDRLNEQQILEEIANQKQNLSISIEEYQQFLAQFKGHEFEKYFGIKISFEVFSKFIFDLCVTWCEILDIEIFAYFILSIFLQSTTGNFFQQLQLKPTNQITQIDNQFYTILDDHKLNYVIQKNKSLKYYRAWCEWNFLRIDEIGESVISKLNVIINNQPLIYSLVPFFESVIDQVNHEIIKQINDSPQNNIEETEQKQKNTQEQKVLSPNNLIKAGQFNSLLSGSTISNPFQAFNRQLDNSIDNINNKSTQSPEIKYMFMQSNEMNQDSFLLKCDNKGNYWVEKQIKLPILGQKIQIKEYTDQDIQKIKKSYFAKLNEITQLSQYENYSNASVKVISQDSVSPDKVIIKSNISNNQSFKSVLPPLRKVVKQSPVRMLPKLNFQFQLQKQDLDDVKKVEMYRPSDEYSQSMNYKRRNIQYDVPLNIVDKFDVVKFKNGVTNNYKEKYGKIQQVQQKQNLIASFYSNNSYLSAAQKTYTDNPTLQNSEVYLGSKEELNFMPKSIRENAHLLLGLSMQFIRSLTQKENILVEIDKLKKEFNEKYKSEYLRILRKDMRDISQRADLGGIITEEDKLKFRERIQKLLKRDKRRKIRRRKKRAQQSVQIGQGLFQGSPKAKKMVKGFKKDLFDSVFINKQSKRTLSKSVSESQDFFE